MTITIPTAELLGLFSDVVAFAADDKDDPHHGVLLSWSVDDGALHACAYNVSAGAIATWEPDQGREADDLQKGEKIDAVNVFWGTGADERDWSVFIDLGDVADLMKAFKVPAGFWRLPLKLETFGPDGTGLTVSRTGEWGRPAVSVSVASPQDRRQTFPDVAAIADESVSRAEALHPDTQLFANWVLGAVGTVRAHGPLQLIHTHPGQPTGLHMGDRWRGFVWCQDDTPSAQALRANSFTRKR